MLRPLESSSTPEALPSHDSPEIDLPLSKRSRTSHVGSTQVTAEMRPGAIVKIRMQNFMTYDDISYDFGPALNMIIGPNGSGKSTVVAGICIGLGFDPKIMGRADKIEATIKHGTQTARIDIELKGRSLRPNIVISRQFGHGQNGSKGQNEWHVDGKRSTQKYVQDIVRSFNCQIDNLCQFLPQDKVASFARLKPVEMLAETLRTIGDGSMATLHGDLVELQTRFNSESTSRTTDEAKLKGLKARQEVLERDVARFKEREAIKQEIRIREKRLPFAKYNEAKEAHTQAKAIYNAAKSALFELRSHNQPLEEQESELTEQTTTADKNATKLHQRLDSAMRKVEAVGNPLRKVEEEMTILENMHKQERDAERNNASRIRDLRERVARDAKALGDEPDVQADIDSLITTAKKLNAADREERNELSELEQYLRNQKNERTKKEEDLDQKERELATLDDVRSHRYALLKQRNPDAALAVDWLKNNRDRFEHRVFDPVLLEIQVTDKKYARAAQHVIMQNAFTFTCQSRRDYQTFNTLLVDSATAGRRLRLNVVEWSKTSTPFLRDQKTLFTPEEIRAYGLDGYLLNCLDGPEQVLNTLCHTAQVHNLPIGSAQLSQTQVQGIEAASKNGRAAFQRYIQNNTDTKIFRGYGQTSSESLAVHNDGSIFAHVVDGAKKKVLQNEIEEIRTNLDDAVADLQSKKHRLDELRIKLVSSEARKKQVNEERQALQKRKSSWLAARAKVEQSQMELDRLTNAPAKYQDNIADIKAKQLQKTKHFTELTLRYKDEIKLAQDLHEKYVVAASRCIQYKANKEAFDRHNRAVQTEIQAAEQALLQARQQKDYALKVAQEIHRQATIAVSDLSEEEKQLISDYDVNTSVETLELDIEDYRNRLTFLAETDGDVLGNYEARAQEIEALQHTVDNKDAVLAELEAQISELRTRFVRELETVRTNIDSSFGEAFRSISCLGEIRIGQPEDFAQWTLEIWVQFRDTDTLQMLTGERQSGGERSVSTIFYLMALQSLSIAPFRVVDEINQGMDPRNERRVHARMVEVACETNTSQYFLITPKLLTDLDYHPNMKVHCVTTGNLGRSGNKIGYSKYLAALRARKFSTQQELSGSASLVH